MSSLVVSSVDETLLRQYPDQDPLLPNHMPKILSHILVLERLVGANGNEWKHQFVSLSHRPPATSGTNTTMAADRNTEESPGSFSQCSPKQSGGKINVDPEQAILHRLAILSAYPENTSVPFSLTTFHWPSKNPLAPNSFTFRPVCACFSLGHLILSKSEKSPLPHCEESRIFASSLRYRHQYNLVHKMRWLLGPGQHELQQAAELSMEGRWYECEFSAEDLLPTHPGVRGSNKDEGTEVPLLSAVGVEKQLLALGARFVGQDSVKLEITRPITTVGIRDLDQVILGNSCLVMGEPLIEDAGASHKPLTIRLSMTLLLANLSRHGVCLMKGPGFPKVKFKEAIEGSIVYVEKPLYYGPNSGTRGRELMVAPDLVQIRLLNVSNQSITLIAAKAGF